MKEKYRATGYSDLFSHTGFGSDPVHWFKFLWENKSEIDWRFIPKICFISVTILLTTPFILYERIALRKRIRQTEIAPPVFILGHPRSGTTYLHYILSCDSRFAFCNTYECFMPLIFFTFGGFIRKLFKASLPETRPMDNLKMGVDLPKEEEFALSCMGPETSITGLVFPRKIYYYFEKYVLCKGDGAKYSEQWKQHLTYFLKKLTLKHGNKTLLLKSPYNTVKVKYLLELFPDAKFIHIYRNPYKVYVSHERLLEKVMPMIAFQSTSNEIIDHFLLQSYVDLYATYFEEKKLIPEGRLIEFRYEDFVGNEMAVLQQIYAKLGFDDFEKVKPAFEKELQEYLGYKTNHYDISDTLKEKIYTNWKFAFDTFGYDKEGKKVHKTFSNS